MDEMIKAKTIVREVAYNFGIRCLVGGSRKSSIMKERRQLIYRLRQETNLTLSEIGELLGGRTPATITTAYQKVAAERVCG